MAARQAALERAWRIMEEKKRRRGELPHSRSLSPQFDSFSVSRHENTRNLRAEKWQEPQTLRASTDMVESSQSTSPMPPLPVKNNLRDADSLKQRLVVGGVDARGAGGTERLGRGTVNSNGGLFPWQPSLQVPYAPIPVILPVQTPVNELMLSKFNRIEEGLQWIHDAKGKSMDVKIKALEDQVNALNGLYHDKQEDGHGKAPKVMEELPISPLSSCNTESTLLTKEDLAVSKKKQSDEEDVRLLQLIRRALGRKEGAASSNDSGSMKLPGHNNAPNHNVPAATFPNATNQQSDQEPKDVRANPLVIEEDECVQMKRFQITISVYGAGIDSVNGEYRQPIAKNDNVFVKSNTSNHIMRIPSFGMNKEKWIICDVLASFEMERDAMIDAVYYSCPCQGPPGTPPPQTGWQADRWGVDPAPRLSISYQVQELSASTARETSSENRQVQPQSLHPIPAQVTASKPVAHMKHMAPQFQQSCPSFPSTNHHISRVKSWNGGTQKRFSTEGHSLPSVKSHSLQMVHQGTTHMSLQEEMVLKSLDAVVESSQDVAHQPVQPQSLNCSPFDGYQQTSDKHMPSDQLQNASSVDQSPDIEQGQWTDLLCDSVMMRMSKDSDGSSAGVGVSVRNSGGSKRNPFVLGGTDVSKLNKRELAAVLGSCFVNNKTAQLVVKNAYGTQRALFLERAKDNSGLGMILVRDRINGASNAVY
eukprot:763633-Hanusia_phi.AAC.2